MNRLEHIDWNQVVAFLQKSANSHLAKERLGAISPLSGPAEAYDSFGETNQAFELLKFEGNRPRLESLDEFEKVLKRLEKNARLDPMELVKTRHFFQDIFSLSRQLADLDTEWSRSFSEKLVDPRPILSYIDQLISTDGEIKTDASETLYKCFHEKRDLKNGIHTLLDRIVKQHDLDNILQDKFVTTRDGRWVLPVKSGMQGKFEGIIHDSSQSKQTVFMEPQEVVKNNNRIRELDLMIEKEIDRLLREVSDYLYEQFRDIEDCFSELVDLDALFAKACLKKACGGSPVEFVKDDLLLRGLSNPILEIEKEEDGEVIKNDLSLDPGKKTLILSGPNAGGKTILLKSLGLASHMARCGLNIPADEGSKIPFFKNIFISVGDAQNITEGLSTFAGHMKDLNEAASMDSDDTLILVDEICGSTDPEEGAALAKAFIDRYTENNSYAFITSHLGSLKQNWRDDKAITHASMEFDDENGKPVYKLIMGVSGSSYALKTAKRIGVDEGILQQAMEHLSPESKERQKKLDDIDRIREELIKSQKQLKFELQQANEQKEKHKRLIDKFKVEKDKKLDQSIKAAEKRIDDELLAARENKSKSAFDIRAELPSIVKKKEETVVETAKEFGAKYPPGTHIFATNIQKNAIIQSLPNSKGEVEILANSMKLSVSWKFLKPKENKEVRFKKSNVSLPKRVDSESTSSTLDLRGKMVEESLQAIDEFCDHALLVGIEKVKVIHGHGTQALKKAVRMHLARATYSERWQAGGEYDGGDGVTWVYLK